MMAVIFIAAVVVFLCGMALGVHMGRAWGIIEGQQVAHAEYQAMILRANEQDDPTAGDWKAKYNNLLEYNGYLVARIKDAADYNRYCMHSTPCCTKKHT